MSIKKALIGAEIIRLKQREPKNTTIKNLFYWLDKLQLKKVINQQAAEGLGFAHDFEILNAPIPNEAFIDMLPRAGNTDEEKLLDAMLFAVLSKNVDAFITEDGRTLANADALGIDGVVNTNRFIERATYKNPQLIHYKSLAVKVAKFKDCNVKDNFFTSFKEYYDGFEEWFAKKSESEVYLCRGDNQEYLGFLFLKPEDEKENYDDIVPKLKPKRRLKVGTFKVESSGFRLGERFIQIIFDHAKKYNVAEIYVTLFKDRDELKRLYHFLKSWGFVEHGIKTHKNGKTETVMVKRIEYDTSKTVQANFPAVQYRKRKLFLPIMAKYHSRLIPDAEDMKKKTDDEFVKNEACRYALEKVYITTATHNPVNNGDLIIVYRMGEGASKAYSSMVTTVGVVKNFRMNFANKDEFLKECQNRSVFSTNELNQLWQRYSKTLGVVRFIVISPFTERPTLKWLWDNNILAGGQGARPFTQMQDTHFDAILKEAGVTDADIKWF